MTNSNNVRGCMYPLSRFNSTEVLKEQTLQIQKIYVEAQR